MPVMPSSLVRTSSTIKSAAVKLEYAVVVQVDAVYQAQIVDVDGNFGVVNRFEHFDNALLYFKLFFGCHILCSCVVNALAELVNKLTS